MGEYTIRTCVDQSNARPLEHDAAVFVRRIEPPLQTVYTIICDHGGQARPWRATRAGQALIRTGPVRLSTRHVYLATWIPADELAEQGDVVEELSQMGRDARYVFQPTQQDARRRRVQAADWQGGAPAFSAADATMVSVLNEIGLPDLAPQVLVSSRLVRREFARQMIDELQEVKMRELGAGFLLGVHDATGQLRDHLLTNPAYRRAGPQRRAEMITAWQQALQTAAR